MNVTVQPDNIIPIVRRMFWLAWNACGSPQGMGVLQDNPIATEEGVWDNVCNCGDYPGPPQNTDGYSGDYVFGRMVKLFVRVEGNTITLHDTKPNPSYQGWAHAFETYGQLLTRALYELSLPTTIHKGASDDSQSVRTARG